MWHALLVGFGGFLGAIARFTLTHWVKRRWSAQIPWGTLTVNWIGSLLLGGLWGIGVSTTAMLFLGTGFLGAFTTFSTLNWESIQLGRQQERIALFTYLLLTYAGGLFWAWVGWTGGDLLP
jgi:fluoride exporter